MITLDLAGVPIPQMRPRFSGRSGTVYDPQSKLREGYKWQLKSQYREDLITAPIEIDITFYMPIPQSASGIRKKQMINGVIHHIKKPDIDNLIKFIFDSMNKIVFHDDSQVMELRARKIYSTKPSTLIRLRILTEQKECDDSRY